MTATAKSNGHEQTERAQRLVARLRHQQLDLARRGRYAESARYAQRTHRVLSYAGGIVWP